MCGVHSNFAGPIYGMKQKGIVQEREVSTKKGCRGRRHRQKAQLVMCISKIYWSSFSPEQEQQTNNKGLFTNQQVTL